jgi:hypothetical protein
MGKSGLCGKAIAKHVLSDSDVRGYMVSKEYVLTKRLKAILKNRNNSLVCASSYCGKPIESGDKVVSTRGYRSRRSSYYHAECYKKLFH